jgi:propanol-preferring alcohol dehydrogenase
MKAMFIEKIGKLEESPLVEREIPIPEFSPDQILIKVSYCGVCHTEIDEVEGRRALGKFPVIPGHEVVGCVVRVGAQVQTLKVGDRVGVAWIYEACGKCDFCESGIENLCRDFVATGADADGGYAEYMVVNEKFAYKLREDVEESSIPPILCAGAVGYRALKLADVKDGEAVALFGFGASNHIVFRYIRHLFPSSRIIVFVKKLGDNATKLAQEMGADYICETFKDCPIDFNKAIDTTPFGEVVVYALSHLNKGGRIVINAIRKETQVPSFDYELIWGEREIKSVANVTRADVREALELSYKIPIKPKVTIFPLEKAWDALLAVKYGEVSGAVVLKVG